MMVGLMNRCSSYHIKIYLKNSIKKFDVTSLPLPQSLKSRLNRGKCITGSKTTDSSYSIS